MIAEYFETIGDKTYREITNFGSETIAKTMYSFNGKVLPWWNLNANLAGYYDYIPKSYNVKHVWVFDGSCANYLTFKRVGSFTVEGNYFTSTIQANYKSSPIGYVNLGYSRYSLSLTYTFHNKHKARSGQIQNDNAIKNRL